MKQIGVLDYEARNDHRGVVLWLTGLSGSGKSTIAQSLLNQLFKMKMQAFWLDGDQLRDGISKDLGFSKDDRSEHIRRSGEVAKLFREAGFIVLCSFISPYRQMREELRRSMSEGDFIEVFVDCPLEVCQERDPKGLYARVKQGEIPNFTGVSAVYENPLTPDIHLKTHQLSIEESSQKILNHLAEHQYLKLMSDKVF